MEILFQSDPNIVAETCGEIYIISVMILNLFGLTKLLFWPLASERLTIYVRRN